MAIPKGLTDEHFRKAVALIDSEGVPRTRNSVHYDLIINKKPYPPKYVISLAHKYNTGQEFSSFNFNAIEAKNYFETRGYRVIDRRKNKEQKFIAPEEDDLEFKEGKERFTLHRKLERSAALSRQVKAKRLEETGRLACDVCDHDFEEVYGDIGRGFIESHHKVPISQLNGETVTKMSDIALVCSNCHRMLHRKELLYIEELKQIVNKAK